LPARTAAAFEGFNDFSSFTADDPAEKPTEVAVARVTVQDAGALVLVRVEGSHFLWEMVRRMVGVLVAAGLSTLDADDVRSLLVEPSRLPAELTAPPSGLFLERVSYGRGEVPDDPVPLRFRFRLRGGRAWLGTNAFFFQEGDANRYRDARYGEFRLDRDSGEAVLVGLRDAKLGAL